METLESIVDFLDANIVNFGFEIGGEKLPLMVVLLLGTGVFLSLRLGLIQLRRLGHGFAMTSGKYDDPNEPGDVSHFQALTTALSATVGIGNIAGVALALHWGGPGAIFWMWVTAFLGMATKYAGVTLAQKYRQVDEKANEWEGSVSGGPMYYIEHGLGAFGKPLAVFFAIMLAFTAFLTGNAIQANTVADTMKTTFGISEVVSGLITSLVVGAVILGGIKRIGKVTGILAPLMAAVYVFGGLVIILLNVGDVPRAFGLIFSEAFNPSAGVAGTGIGALLVTLMWGVKRGLFSNEAGQGSAPIAHAAAKTDEPVSEGVVALLEPFIDTIVICSMTALVILLTGVWNDRTPTEVTLTGGDAVYLIVDDQGRSTPTKELPESIRVEDGRPIYAAEDAQYGWHDVAVEAFYTDIEQTVAFDGVLLPTENIARGEDGTEYESLFCPAVESGAPMTMWAFRRGLSPLGDWGHFVVLFSVLLFAISTAIAWSYYGDRCANYLFGPSAVLPYKLLFVAAHFTGSILSLSVVWKMGDIALAVVIIPNLIALLVLSGEVKSMTDSYFSRRPWLENKKSEDD
ncbi:MAG: sodium:alanine symporter family protein [Planctomycetota bacterium]